VKVELKKVAKELQIEKVGSRARLGNNMSAAFSFGVSFLFVLLLLLLCFCFAFALLFADACYYYCCYWLLPEG
jgi:hypothetical protein